MCTIYTYRIVKEHPDGTQSARTRTIERGKPLKVGGLYYHLGNGLRGAYRVLKLISEVMED